MLTERPVNKAGSDVSPETENSSSFGRVIIITDSDNPESIKAVVATAQSSEPEAAYLYEEILNFQEKDQELFSEIRRLTQEIQSNPKAPNANYLKAQLNDLETRRTGYRERSKNLNPNQSQLRIIVLNKEGAEISGWTTREFSETANAEVIEEQSDWWKVFLTLDQSGVQALRIYNNSPPQIQKLAQDYFKFRKLMLKNKDSNPESSQTYFADAKALLNDLTEDEENKIYPLIKAITNFLNTAKA